MKENTTAQLVKKYILNNPFLIDFLKRDLINITSFAREILPQILKENSKATIESISIAIKRLDLRNQNLISLDLEKVIKNTQINLRDDVVLICINDSKDIPNSLNFKKSDLFYVNQGSNEITIIIDKKNIDLIKVEEIYEKNNLSAISLKGDYRNCPGFVYTFLSKIALIGINIVDMISTHSQFTFIVEEKDSLKVYELFRKIKKI